MNKYDVVLLSTADWDNPFWTNKQHVAVELARLGHRVLYVDSLGLRRPAVGAQDLKRILGRLSRAVRLPRRVQANLWVWSPIALPWHGNNAVRRINRCLLRAGTWISLKYLGMHRELLWTYNPLTTEYLDLAAFGCSVYHCVDDIKAQPGMPVEVLERAEEQLARNVDVVFASSPKLTETRRVWNAKTHYVPNVADYEHFSTSMLEQTREPTDLQGIPRPRLGFIGAISSYKLDFRLIRYIAESRPDWSVILIGRVGEGDPWTEDTLLKGLPNLHLLGERAYRDLPAYLKGIDVALLPNAVNEYTDSMFPMKFFEYLAAGRPIVSVNLKAIQEFSSVIAITETHADFVSAIEAALNGKVAKLSKRLEIAQKYTYVSRTQGMLRVIDEIVGTWQG